MDIGITDAPYADAINYHEITDYFIAWLRKNPPPPLHHFLDTLCVARNRG